MNALPSFIIIGGGKCGTTSLHNYLNQHPQIYICPQKETFFFTDEKSRSRNQNWGAVTDLGSYSALFQDAPQDNILGEISTVYYSYPRSAQLIYDLIPKVQIIAILRNPGERAFSDYQMHFRAGREKSTFESLVKENNKYIKKGFYYQKLMPYFQTFPKEQIKIILFDDFKNKPVDCLQDLFNFLGVDSEFVPDMNHRGREGGVPKNQNLNQILTKPNPVRSSIATVLKLFLPLEIRQNFRNKLVRKNMQKPKLEPSVKQDLVNIYRQDILQLQKLIERDLSSWLE